MRRVCVHACSLVLSAVAGVRAADRIVLAGDRFLQGNKRFVVRGIGYSDAAVGERGGSHLSGSSCRWARDLPLLAATGANTVRTYGLLPEGSAPFLDLLDSTGMYWLADFPLEPYYDPAQTILARRHQILEDFETYARRFRSQRRLIGYVFGDEVARDYPAKFAGTPEDFYTLLGEAAEVLRKLEPEQPPLLTTAVHDLAELGRAPAGLSFWCWNANPGRSFGALLEAARRTAALPVLVSQFGVDAFDQGTGQENEAAQAEAAGRLLKEIETAEWLLGGIYVSLADEWWRGSADPSRHGLDGTPHAAFPDGFRNAGWLGLFRVTPTPQAGLDSLHPRAAFRVLAERWGGRGLPAEEGVPRLVKLVNAASGEERIAPGVLVRGYGERLSPVATAEASWPLHLGLTSVCFAGAAARMGMLAPGELSAQVPGVLPPGETSALVYRAGRAGEVLPVTLSAYAPGIFPGGVVQAGSTCPADASNSARPGDVLEVYATGLGAGQVQAELAGRPVPVLYSGPVPAAVGLHQVNLRIPAEMPPSRGSGLRLLVEGIPSNVYPLSVAAPDERPAVVLRASPSELVLQAGGDPGEVGIHVEAVNGFCGPLVFRADRAPQGVSFHAPTAFPGQTVPLVVRAASGAMAPPGSTLVLTGSSGSVSGQLAVRLEVLPCRGDIPVRVISAGFPSGSAVRFDWAWRTVFSAGGGGPGRGISVMSVHPVTGVFSPARTFDTWGDEQAAAALVRHLEALPAGTIVLMAVSDDGSYRLSRQAREAITGWFGSRFIAALGYQHSWALIGRKGASPPLAEGTAENRPVVLETVLTLPQR